METKPNLIFLLILASVFLGSCVTEKLVNSEGQFVTYSFDFREYAETGFLFTPNRYEDEHTVLGMITVELHPEIEYLKIPDNISTMVGFSKIGYKALSFYHGSDRMIKYTKDIDIQELIKEVYSISTNWGGDGFMQLMIDRKIFGDNPKTSYDYLSMTGVVIN